MYKITDQPVLSCRNDATSATAPIPIPGRTSIPSWRSTASWSSSLGTSPSDSTRCRLNTSKLPRNSGYATQNHTSNVSPEDHASSKFGADIATEKAAIDNLPKSIPLPSREDLQAFKMDPDQAFLSRYKEIQPELQRLLQKQMMTAQKSLKKLFQPSGNSSKTKRNLGLTMSIRLMTVGQTFSDAKPAIVIFAHGGEQTSSSLENLLRQPLVRQLYRPEDGITPNFEVIVVGEGPRKRFSRELSAAFDHSSLNNTVVTYCGAKIHFETTGSNTRPAYANATLGGVVKLTFGPRDFALVGMTAGHVLEDLFSSDEDEDEDDDTLDTSSHRYSQRRLLGKLVYPTMNPNPTDDEDEDEDIKIPSLDWALFEMNPTLKIKPNVLPRQGHGPGDMYQCHRPPPPRRRRSSQNSNPLRLHENCMTTAPPESFPSMEPISVVMVTSSNHKGIMLGELSHLPARIMLNPDHGCVEAYLVSLHDDSVQDGHSGAWIINPISCEVYGHVVATDITGDAYMIPLHSSLAEMKSLLPGIESVDLPTTADLVDLALRGSSSRTDSDLSHHSSSSTDDTTTTGRNQRDPASLSRNITDQGGRGPPQQHSTQGKGKERDDDSRDRRVSEVISLCESSDMNKVNRLLDLSLAAFDSDSGYGSVDTVNTPMKDLFVDYDDDDYGGDDGQQKERVGMGRRQGFWEGEVEEEACAVW
ncbi:hypothetical protein B0H66DRAFT_560105 [Apodospora peruviana]|uniref:Uncharacterized protein n=1 Tax=Apodospora peruviana TaxID=516989 RepID=A0AAE0M1U8_9PEZI|nr:hypothetical protein B0H66DRAFT_560105 [Apodospora peruviana]